MKMTMDRVAPGHFECPVCHSHIGPADVPHSTPVCQPKDKHLNAVVMVRVAATAAERKRRQRAKR